MLRPLLGVDERNIGKYGGIEIITERLRRNPKGKIIRLGYKLVYCPTIVDSKPIATLMNPDGYGGGRSIGSYAITVKENGNGLAVFTGIPAKTILATPSLFLDLIDLCLTRIGKGIKWELEGLNDMVDSVIRDELLVLFNHGSLVEVKAKYLGELSSYEVLGNAKVSYSKGIFKIKINRVEHSIIKVNLNS